MGTGGDVATDHVELRGCEHSLSSRKLHKSGKDEVGSVNSVKKWATLRWKEYLLQEEYLTQPK